MISGKATTEAGLLLAGLLVLLSPVASAELTLSALLEPFARVSAAQARFTETRQLELLETPLVTEGTLSYRAPDYLKKEVSRPEHSLFEISGDELRIASADQQRTLPLDRHPLIRAFAESYRAILAGDAATLSRHFETTLSGSLDDWSLHLVPRDRQVQAHMAAIVVRGSHAQIRSTETREPSGDVAVMMITPADDPGRAPRDGADHGNATVQPE